MTTTTRAAYAAHTDAADAAATAAVWARLAARAARADGDTAAAAEHTARAAEHRADAERHRHAAALEAAARGTTAEVRTVRVVLYSTATRGQRRARITGPGLAPVTVALDYSAADPYAAAVAEVFPAATVAGRFTAAADRYARRTPRAEVFRLEFTAWSAE